MLHLETAWRRVVFVVARSIVVAPEKGAGFSVIENNRVKFPAHIYFLPRAHVEIGIPIVSHVCIFLFEPASFPFNFDHDRKFTLSTYFSHASTRVVNKINYTISVRSAYEVWSKKCEVAMDVNPDEWRFRRAKFTSVRTRAYAYFHPHWVRSRNGRCLRGRLLRGIFLFLFFFLFTETAQRTIVASRLNYSVSRSCRIKVH